MASCEFAHFSPVTLDSPYSPSRYVTVLLNKFKSTDVEGTSEVFGVVLGLTSCSLAGGYQQFTGTRHFQLQGEFLRYDASFANHLMTMYLPTSVAGLLGTETVPAILQVELHNNMSGHGRLPVLGIDLRLFRQSVR